MPEPLHLAVALDGAGWHPAAWREPDARPAELFTAGYWADLVAEAERGLLDFVTIEDSLGLQSDRSVAPDDRTDQVRGRLDAVLIAARVAPLTRHIGLVPTAIVTHTEPFHVSKAIATLDYVSTGRAGVRVQVSARPDEAAHFGRRTFPTGRSTTPTRPCSRSPTCSTRPPTTSRCVRRLWDSWEDDAEIRDVATGRFVDRDKLHYIDFEGRSSRVKGPSITPAAAAGPAGRRRARATATSPYQLVARARRRRLRHPARRRATPPRSSPRSAPSRTPRAAAARPCTSSATSWCSSTTTAAAARRARRRLDELRGRELRQRRRSLRRHPGAAGRPAAGVAGGRADRLPAAARRAARTTSTRSPTGSCPSCSAAARSATAYEADTLRGLLGLPRPANRYAAD